MGKYQFVPVVIKNRECLVSFIDQFHVIVLNIRELLEDIPSIKKSLKEDIVDMIQTSCLALDNTRFNGWAKDGINLDNIKKEELVELIRQSEESANDAEVDGENGKDILESDYFHIHCACGNYVNFKGPHEIPEHNLKCDICERILIDYMGLHDHEIEYDEVGTNE